MKQISLLLVCSMFLVVAACGGGGAEGDDAANNDGFNGATIVTGIILASDGSPLPNALVYIPIATSENIITSTTLKKLKATDECGTPLMTACASVCTQSDGGFSLDVSGCTGNETILQVLKSGYSFTATIECVGAETCELGNITSSMTNSSDDNDDTSTDDFLPPEEDDDSASYYALNELSAYNGVYSKDFDSCTIQYSWGAWGCDGGSVAYFPFSSTISVSSFQSSSFSLSNSALAPFDSRVSNPIFSQYNEDYPVYNASYFIGDYECVQGQISSRGLSGSGIADAAIASYTASCLFMPFTYYSGDSSTDWLMGSCARQDQSPCEVYFYK